MAEQESCWSTWLTHSSDHCFCTCCPSVPTFQNLTKQKQTASENNVYYWRDCGCGRVDHLLFSLFILILWSHKQRFMTMYIWDCHHLRKRGTIFFLFLLCERRQLHKSSGTFFFLLKTFFKLLSFLFSDNFQKQFFYAIIMRDKMRKWK